MKKLANLISKYFGGIIVIFMIFGFVIPMAFGWVTSQVFGQSVINYLLGIIMFGMGMTLSIKDFKLVLEKPLHILGGAVAQFTIMPLLAFGLAKVFGLSEALLVGVVLVGTYCIKCYLIHGRWRRSFLCYNDNSIYIISTIFNSNADIFIS